MPSDKYDDDVGPGQSLMTSFGQICVPPGPHGKGKQLAVASTLIVARLDQAKLTTVATGGGGSSARAGRSITPHAAAAAISLGVLMRRNQRVAAC